MVAKKKQSYMRQFKPGTYPDQHWDESTRVNGHEAGPPSPEKVKARKGLALGTQEQANPGMVGKADFPRGKRKR